MRGDHDLAGIGHAISTLERKDVQDLADEGLLQLGVEMCLGFLDEDEMHRRAVVVDCQPLGVQIEKLNHHEDEVLESQTIVAVGQRRRIGRAIIGAKGIVDQRARTAAHNLCRIERRSYHHPGV